MIPIQVLLTALLTVVFLAAALVLRSRLLSRIFGVCLYAGGVAMIIRPDWANLLANLVGIGRGADLLLYLFVLASVFFWLGLYGAMRESRRKTTLLVRHLAISSAVDKRLRGNQ